MQFQDLNAPKNARGQMGKEVEKLVREWLEAKAAASMRFAYHRYPDARSAQGPLGAQPSDFLVAQAMDEARRMKWVCHLEAKDTEELRRLPKKAIKQWGKLLMFWHAGIEVRVLIRRSAVGDWVVLTDKELFEFEECPKSFLMTGLKSYPTHAAALSEIFQ